MKSTFVLSCYPFNIHRNRSECCLFFPDIGKMYLLSLFGQSSYRFISFTNFLKNCYWFYWYSWGFFSFYFLDFFLWSLLFHFLLNLNIFTLFFLASQDENLSHLFGNVLFFPLYWHIGFNKSSSKHCFISILPILLCSIFSLIQLKMLFNFPFSFFFDAWVLFTFQILRDFPQICFLISNTVHCGQKTYFVEI